MNQFDPTYTAVVKHLARQDAAFYAMPEGGRVLLPLTLSLTRIYVLIACKPASVSMAVNFPVKCSRVVEVERFIAHANQRLSSTSLYLSNDAHLVLRSCMNTATAAPSEAALKHAFTNFAELCNFCMPVAAKVVLGCTSADEGLAELDKLSALKGKMKQALDNDAFFAAHMEGMLRRLELEPLQLYDFEHDQEF